MIRATKSSPTRAAQAVLLSLAALFIRFHATLELAQAILKAHTSVVFQAREQLADLPNTRHELESS